MKVQTKANPATQQAHSITFKTKSDDKINPRASRWWAAESQEKRGKEMIASCIYLKESQSSRQRDAAIYARLYGNMALFSFIGNSVDKLNKSLPVDRPTFNLVQSATDTLISRVSQDRPTPVFLTDNSDYRQRNLAKKLNTFVQGEFFRLKSYELGTLILRDALVEGTGCMHVFETPDHKVGLERVFLTELFTDHSESLYADPRQLFRVKLVDRSVLLDATENKGVVRTAEQAYPDNSSESSKTISDLVLVVEGWHLPSGKGAKDGRHTIACSSGTILDAPYEKDTFPFIFLHYSPRLLGFWAQGLAEQLMGTQIEINSILFTIARAMKIVGVPRVFVEQGSKVAKSQFNNEIGTIITYQGTKPIFEVAPCVPEELYAQLQRLINYGYQQCGVSSMQAGAQKPAGLNSGEAIRSYDDISTDRFATLARRYTTFYVDLAYVVTDLAKDIAREQGKYATVYPGKNTVKEVNLPEADLLENCYVIQAFNMSSLPRDPAGRLAKVTEMVQAGMITLREGRRLLDYPDLGQMETLANASEERIFQYLDDIIEEGKFCPPDQFMDLELAEQLSVQYYNLYASAKLEPEKVQMLINFWTQANTYNAAAKQVAMPQASPGAPGPQGQPMATPEPLPQSPLIQQQPAAA